MLQEQDPLRTASRGRERLIRPIRPPSYSMHEFVNVFNESGTSHAASPRVIGAPAGASRDAETFSSGIFKFVRKMNHTSTSPGLNSGGKSRCLIKCH